MTPPAAPPRHARPVEPAPPPAAIAGAVIALIGALVLFGLAFLVLALGGLDSDGSGRLWALLPLAGGGAAAVGGVRLLRRRGRLLLALAAVLAAVFAGVPAAQAAGRGEEPPVGMALLLLAGPLVALGLSLTPTVRSWLAGRS